MGKKISGNRVTADDVARVAGVSRSLVSRTFTKGASVSEKRRKLVLEAARKLGYEPNIAARVLAGKASNVVGILIGPLLNPFLADLLDKLSDRLRDEGFLPTLFKVSTEGDAKSILPFISQYNMVSTIVMGISPSARVSRMFASQSEMPIVLNLGVLRDVEAAIVTTDHFSGGMLAAQALLDRGAERPALVTREVETGIYEERAAGFRHVLDQAGVACTQLVVAEGSYEAGHAATLTLMDGAHGPDAVFFGNDMMALGGMDALRRDLGLAVPDDVAVVGYDDIPGAALGAYRISTIRQPVDKLAAKAVSVIVDFETTGAADLTTSLISPEFISRETT
ncbi:LacI family DNA-binding transcriptional regulator [Marinovum sp.]|uniref:LacI family DNA-binding transcriptional regulator n=1 Tax=Marinovum sp. TaxID=2024839 RepID=UPI002B2785D2|nr:LacI family DNA-binding transcriptional regulator [Marinovum sp.]